ncbi:MAG TPA: hypothetical protein VN878_01690 [Usitatibacter sp.]|nr:hypothetical protein [Usitatibacter sp.]
MILANIYAALHKSNFMPIAPEVKGLAKIFAQCSKASARAAEDPSNQAFNVGTRWGRAG